MSIPKGQEKLIREIRERYTYALSKWKDIREEARIDMRYISGDPWDPADKKQREEAGRPALQMDELNQFTNQAINNLRQNQRGIKVNPAGNGATDKSAEFHQGLIRGIEYRSNAQRSAYIPAFENALQRSYGFFYVKRRYLPGKTFDQEIYLEGELNPDRVLYDPDVKKADWSDAEYCFVFGTKLRIEEFKRKYPKAKVSSFDVDDFVDSDGWVDDEFVLTAEYWKAEKVERELLLFETPEGPQIFYKDELPKEFALAGLKPSRTRKVEERKIYQYVTNGVEILEDNGEQPGQYIPIVPVVGKEMFVEGKRVLLSLVRLARDPFMAYCYLWSQMIEEAKMTPKTPLMGYVGQFETDADAIQSITDVPHTHIQFDPVVDQASGQILPLPSRPQFTPNFPAYNVILDAARRAIMSAVGIMPMPTAAQRQNEKSGIALEKIQTQESIGSFHFTDNFDRALEFAGRIIESWLPTIYDTEREVGIRHDDDTHSIVKINTAQPYEQDGEQHHYPLVDDNGDGLGNHDIEITTGPSYQSQRDEAADFAGALAKTPLFPKIADLLVKLRNLGPIGDEIAERLTPPEFAKQGSPAQLQGNLQQAVTHLQAMHAYAQQLEAKLQQLQQEKQAKVVDNQFKQQMEEMKLLFDAFKAEVMTKAQDESERRELFMGTAEKLLQQMHEFNLQKDQQAHEQGMAQQAAANQAAMAEQNQPADQQPQA